METDHQESCVVPPGFRFHPTDEELVGYYLRKKVASQKIDLEVIRDIDLYRIEPWDLQEKCGIGYEEQNEWYFFSHKDKKYPTGTRTNRATMAGFWKATGRDKAVYDKSRLIGMRKTLVFYKGRAPNGQKSDWIMHEYRLESDENAPPQEEGWVVCRAFKKRITGQLAKTNHFAWESNYCYNYDHHQQPNIINNANFMGIVGNNINNNNNNPDTSNSFMAAAESFLSKQELAEAAVMHHRSSDDRHNLFTNRLPQLQSPSLVPPAFRQESRRDDELDGGGKKTSVRDWRALDKFVASQLSHDDNCSSYGREEEDDNGGRNMAELLLLQREEGGGAAAAAGSSKLLNELLSSSSRGGSSEGGESNNISIFLFDG
ncbi:unnamed protein product [Cuscuta campestris]|uniref:NAC domain-containing protein n=1 Tax=Cuscuta campestris TaxID=132261 RepID=A0A484LGL3_9ASTE|nr:unnamed protein product [Cuscuta campestris]